jgi:DNA-binding MarR family transcriptional regulator
MKPSPERHELSQSIAQLLPNVIQGVHISFLAQKNLTHTQFFVLIAIHSRSQLSMRTLSDSSKVSMPTMTGIVERLVKGGYVKRAPHAEDRRQIMIELTVKGKQVITEFQIAVAKRWEEVLGILSDKEIRSFKNIVIQLRERLKVRGT